MTRTPTITTRLQLDDAKGEPIAHVTVSHRSGVLWLTDVWTHSEHRKQGYARQLITQALGMFADQSWYLEVYPYTDQPLDFERLTQFYQDLGFTATDVPGVMKR